MLLKERRAYDERAQVAMGKNKIKKKGKQKGREIEKNTHTREERLCAMVRLPSGTSGIVSHDF